MKKFVMIFAVLAQSLLMYGCAAWQGVSYADDLYSVHNKIAIAERQKAEAELAKAHAPYKFCSSSSWSTPPIPSSRNCFSRL